jgi:hypothetical protein
MAGRKSIISDLLMRRRGALLHYLEKCPIIPISFIDRYCRAGRQRPRQVGGGTANWDDLQYVNSTYGKLIKNYWTL